jgi:hypothetical protein
LAPSISISPPLPDQASQPVVGVTLDAEYPQDISGKITLAFVPDVLFPSDDTSLGDPDIKFLHADEGTGGKAITFVITAGTKNAVFPGDDNAVGSILASTGTTAGTIKLKVTLTSGGKDITPSPNPEGEIIVQQMPPNMTSVTIASRSSSGFSVVIDGFSTPREVTQATFSFSGNNLVSASPVIPLANDFTNWYESRESMNLGSKFRLTVPFTVQGNVGDIRSVSVTLSNSKGTSKPQAASF